MFDAMLIELRRGQSCYLQGYYDATGRYWVVLVNE
jgi:hypothetical protein